MKAAVTGLLFLVVFPVIAAASMPAPLVTHLNNAIDTLTINEISSLPASQFVEGVPEHSDSNTYWLRIELPQALFKTGESWYLQITFPNIDKVDVFVQQSNSNAWASYRVGDDTPFNNWPVDFRIPTIPLGDNPKSLVYAKVTSYVDFTFPLRLLTGDELEHQIRQSDGYYSAIFSALFVLIISNFILYLFIRDSSYFYYVVYITAFSAVQMSVNGLGQQLFWPELDGGTTIIALIAIAVTNLFLPLFAIDYLSLQHIAPKLTRFIRLCAVLPMLILPLLFLENYKYAQISLHLVSTLNMLLVLFISFRRTFAGDRLAAYMSISYSVLFFAIALALLHQNRVIETGFWVQHMMELATVFEALLLSIGLADRINRIRLENVRISNEKKDDQRKFYRALISVEEKEKSRLGRLLHDGIGHDLLVLKNQLKNPSEKNEMMNQIDLLSKKVRDISHLFHPFHLEQLGFSLAAEQLVETTFKNADIEAMIAIDDIELPRHIELELFQALQECLNNVIKHSGASEALVRFSRQMVNDQAMAVLVVKDDGTGLFEADKGGMGLRMIRESIESLSGFFSIKQNESVGTEVRISVPV